MIALCRGMVTHLPYADTRAAFMLDSAIRRYTTQNAGGLRALAARIGIKQATVLSHMANGRIGIPLDRATQLAEVLGMDATEFSMAVLQQREPEIFKLLSPTIAKNTKPPKVTECVTHLFQSGATISPLKMRLIVELLASPDANFRHATGSEAQLLNLIRNLCPMGPSESEWAELQKAAYAILR